MFFHTYVSTSDNANGCGGVYHLLFNCETRQFDLVGKHEELGSGLYLAACEKQNMLLAVGNSAGKTNEIPTPGSVAAYRINPANGELQFLNSEKTNGGSPCFVAFDSAGEFAFIANFRGPGDVGSVSLFKCNSQQGLLSIADHHIHSGSSVNPIRQKCAHPHCIIPGTANDLVYSADLGADKIVVYSFNRKTEKLEPRTELCVMAPRSGMSPRHLAFHPNGKFAFLNTESDNGLCIFKINTATGELVHQKTISTIPENQKLAGNSPGDIFVHPTGKLLAVSNRGHESIALFRLDPESGNLFEPKWFSSGGICPRGFGFSPDGRFLFAANQNTNNLAPFEVNVDDATLKPGGKHFLLPSPIAVAVIAAQVV